MSGARLPYFERRNGIWNLRVRVPDGAKLRVGMLEVRRSLRTYSAERARFLAVQLIARLREIFRMAQSSEMTKDDVCALIEACFEGLRTDTEGGAPIFADPAREIHEQYRMVDERLQELRQQIRGGTFDRQVEGLAIRLLRDHGYDVEALPHGLKRDLAEGVARALMEQQRLYEFRLEDRLAPNRPSDPLFATSNPEAAGPKALQRPTAQGLGPTVREAVDRYLKAKQRSWVAKTPTHRARQLNMLVEHLGPDRCLATTCKDDLRAFRDPSHHPSRLRSQQN